MDWPVADAQLRRLSRERSRSTDFGPSLAQQGFRDQAEPYRVAARFGVGMAPPVTPFDPRHYGEFDMGMDLRDAQDRVARAAHAFQLLPAELRFRFNHDPAQVIDFLADPRNLDEARALGLAPPLPPPDNPPAA